MCVCMCAHVHVCVLARVCATVCKVCTRVPNCAMHWRLYICMPVYLFAHQSNTRHLCVYCSCHSSPACNTLRHLDTHTLVGIWAGICIGSLALVSGVHKKRQRAVIQTQPLVSFLGMCCVCECVCASSRDTVVVLSGLRNGTLQPRFPRSLAQHATVTARQLALRLWRGVRSQHYVSECVCLHSCGVCLSVFM